MIPISEYSQKTNISEEKLVKMIREGFYSGRIVEGKWYIDESPNKELSNATTRPRYFRNGIIMGAVFALIVGLLSYPWSNPYFEGSAGYHMVFMIMFTPISLLCGGVLFWVYGKVFNRGK